jgi:DNA polymerase delta subunit 1
MKERWLRPPNQCTNNVEDLSLQWFDMDMIGGYALSQNPNETLDDRRVVGASEGQVPVIRAFGVTEAGNSATVFIHGFTPYGYFALPEGATFDHTEDNLAKIRMYLNDRLEGQARGGKLHEYCHAVSYETDQKSIMGYESPHTHFFRVLVAMPTLIPTLKRIMEDGLDLAGVTTTQGNEYSAFECNVPFVLRYMIDNDISGAGWLTLPKRTYQVRQASDRKTHCQVRAFRAGCKSKPNQTNQFLDSSGLFSSPYSDLVSHLSCSTSTSFSMFCECVYTMAPKGGSGYYLSRRHFPQARGRVEQDCSPPGPVL